MTKADKFLWGFAALLLALTVGGLYMEFSGHHTPVWYMIIICVVFEGSILSLIVSLLSWPPEAEAPFE